jgi:transposase
MDSIEISMQNAIEDYNSGRIPSYRAAAIKWGVSKSTLYDRIKGRTSQHVAQQPQQRLNPEQESFLAEWVIEQDAQGFSPSHARVREMALRILQINGDAKPLGKNWTTGFLHRNPRVATCIGQKIEHLRIKCSQPALMNAFYTRQETIRANYPLTPA